MTHIGQEAGFSHTGSLCFFGSLFQGLFGTFTIRYIAQHIGQQKKKCYLLPAPVLNGIDRIKSDKSKAFALEDHRNSDQGLDSLWLQHLP